MSPPPFDPRWPALRDLLDFAKRLAVVFIFSDSAGVAPLRRRTERACALDDRPFARITIDAPTTLRTHALSAVVEREPDTLVWLEAFGPQSLWASAWSYAAQRWNERREPLRRSHLRALIVCAPTWAKPVIRQAAPDLWSIMNLLLEPPPRRQPEQLALPFTEPSMTPTIAERMWARRAATQWIELLQTRPRGDHINDLAQAIHYLQRLVALGELDLAHPLALALAPRLSTHWSIIASQTPDLARCFVAIDEADVLLRLLHRRESLLNQEAKALAEQREFHTAAWAYLQQAKTYAALSQWTAARRTSVQALQFFEQEDYDSPLFDLIPETHHLAATCALAMGDSAGALAHAQALAEHAWHTLARSHPWIDWYDEVEGDVAYEVDWPTEIKVLAATWLSDSALLARQAGDRDLAVAWSKQAVDLVWPQRHYPGAVESVQTCLENAIDVGADVADEVEEFNLLVTRS